MAKIPLIRLECVSKDYTEGDETRHVLREASMQLMEGAPALPPQTRRLRLSVLQPDPHPDRPRERPASGGARRAAAGAGFGAGAGAARPGWARRARGRP